MANPSSHALAPMQAGHAVWEQESIVTRRALFVRARRQRGAPAPINGRLPGSPVLVRDQTPWPGSAAPAPAMPGRASAARTMSPASSRPRARPELRGLAAIRVPCPFMPDDAVEHDGRFRDLEANGTSSPVEYAGGQRPARARATIEARAGGALSISALNAVTARTWRVWLGRHDARKSVSTYSG